MMLLKIVLIVLVSVQLAYGFVPPAPIADSTYFTPASPISTGITTVTSITSLTPGTPVSPGSYSEPPISIITLPPAFSYKTGPFAPFTHISGSGVNKHNGHNGKFTSLPSLYQVNFSPIDNFSPLFPYQQQGHQNWNSASALPTPFVALLSFVLLIALF